MTFHRLATGASRNLLGPAHSASGISGTDIGS